MTHPPFRVVAFSGSLRRASTNSGLVRLAIRIAPPELSITLVDWVHELPWMNPDLEADLPPVVRRWHDAVRDADALLIGMPEYNYGPTGLAKNALDWLTRPLAERPINGKTLVFLSSGGRSGGGRSQDAMAEVLTRLGATIVEEPPVRLALAADRFDEHGDTDDPEVVDLVRAKLAALIHALTQRGREVIA